MDFGPTLLGWLEKHAQDVYEAILDADAQSRGHFSGHGSALAQAYNHIIMPLANHRDKYTQIYWGIRDFEHRFGRRPEGMWLPETAVDLETLDILAELGIRFTILSPFQAQRVRSIESRKWQDVSGGKIDATKPYLVLLPSGKNKFIIGKARITNSRTHESTLYSFEVCCMRASLISGAKSGSIMGKRIMSC